MAAAQPRPSGEPGRRIVIRPDAAPPSHPAADAGAGLRRLLAVERDFRRAETRAALMLAFANESARLCEARQAFVLRAGRGGSLQVECVSGLATVERHSPLLRWIEGRVSALPAEEASRPHLLETARDPDPEAAAYPFREAHWTPFPGRPSGGLLLTREVAWTEAEAALAGRLAETAAHALRALGPDRRLRLAIDRRVAFGIGAAALCALALPVPLTVLAPATVTAERPFVIAAPIDGIVGDIAVAPNEAVAEGDAIVRYVDTAQRNALAVAERDVQVAEARLRQLTQGAYTDDKARRELGQARAELALKAAERDFARDTFARTVVRAERAGVAVYADRKEWFGKPVAAGQRILEIADPATVEIRIDLAVADAIALPPGARTRLFLDTDPLHPVEAEVTQVTPIARVTEAGVLAHRVTARIDPGDGAAPRLGAHGTAQIYGPRVPFCFYLLRRPLTWMRQRIGM